MIEWLISTNEFKRLCWILEAQLSRLVLKIIKNENYEDLFKTTETSIFLISQMYPLSMDNYINLIYRGYCKTLYTKFDGRLENFISAVNNSKGYI